MVWIGSVQSKAVGSRFPTDGRDLLSPSPPPEKLAVPRPHAALARLPDSLYPTASGERHLALASTALAVALIPTSPAPTVVVLSPPSLLCCRRYRWCTCKKKSRRLCRRSPGFPPASGTSILSPSQPFLSSSSSFTCGCLDPGGARATPEQRGCSGGERGGMSEQGLGPVPTCQLFCL